MRPIGQSVRVQAIARRALACCLIVLCAACSGSGSSDNTQTSSSKKGTSLTVRFSADRPTDVALVRSILLKRFAALGLNGASVNVDRARHLLFINLPGARPVSPAVWRLAINTEELRFRPLLGELPYGASSPSTAASSAQPTTVTSCENGALVTPRGKDTTANPQEVLPDRPDKNGRHQICYVLGPTLLTGRAISSASSTFDSSQGGWLIEVHFKNDDFVNKVAKPEVNKQVAIVLDGVVQSAPTLQPGITGRDVQITGSFTEQEASNLALVLKYGALPVQLQFVSATPSP
jgi:preprotein translocase subunit SecD